MSAAKTFVKKSPTPMIDGTCFHDRETIARYFNYLLKEIGRAGRVFIFTDKMMYVSQSLRVETTLDKLLVEFAPHVENEEQVIEVLQSAGERFLKEIEPGTEYVNDDFDPSKVSLALMDRLQVVAMEEEMKKRRGEQRAPYEMPLTFRQFGELYLSPVIEVKQGTVPVTEIMCAAMDVEPNDLFDIGLSNLKSHFDVGDIHIETSSNGVRSIDSWNPPASSLFLLKEFWEEQERELGCPPALRIVTGDVIIFAPSTDEKAMAALGPKWDYASRIGEFPKPMSKETFIWSDGTFKVA
jgi:hypothetical protein